MKCRPGDLAVIIKARNRCNVGKIVKVIALHDGKGDLVISGAWLVHCAHPLVWQKKGKLYRRKQGPAPDDQLWPIRELPQDSGDRAAAGMGLTAPIVREVTECEQGAPEAAQAIECVEQPLRGSAMAKVTRNPNLRHLIGKGGFIIFGPKQERPQPPQSPAPKAQQQEKQPMPQVQDQESEPTSPADKADQASQMRMMQEMDGLLERAIKKREMEG